MGKNIVNFRTAEENLNIHLMFINSVAVSSPFFRNNNFKTAFFKTFVRSEVHKSSFLYPFRKPVQDVKQTIKFYFIGNAHRSVDFRRNRHEQVSYCFSGNASRFEESSIKEVSDGYIKTFNSLCGCAL